MTSSPSLVTEIAAGFATASTLTALKWVFLGLFCLVFIIYMVMEQRRMLHYYKRLVAHASSQDTTALDYLLKLISRMSRMILMFSLAVVILAFSIIFYDIKERSSHKLQLLNMQKDEECLAKIDANTQAEKIEAPVTEPTALADPIPVESVVPPAPLLDSDLDKIKRDYEQAFVNYYILHKCGKATPETALQLDNALLQSLLEHEVTGIANFRKNIHQSASGTYSELYANTNCQEDSVTKLQKELNTYIQSLRSKTPDFFTNNLP